MSETPRTNDECRRRARLRVSAWNVSADFARELERELAAVKDDLAQRTAERDALAAEVAALKAHDPLADYQEKVASIVYAAMRFDREDVTPEWQAGNSHAEYRARQAATEIAEMLRCARTAERDEAWLTNATLRADLARANAERDDLAAEIAALKAQPDPLAEMWAALDEYQPMADRDGHGKSWRRMCRERTVNAAWDAYHSSPSNKSSGLWSSRAAADAARAANFGNHAKDVIALIRRAKEVQR
jgi:cell division protein FtsB